MPADALLDHVTFDADGLVAAVVQDRATREVLMVAYMNAEALRRTLASGTMTYWSRSRGRLWVKGETSGRTQRLHEVRIDCDGDALVFLVEQHGGAACHTGHRSCFYRTLEDGALAERGAPVFDPSDVYGG